MKPLEGWSGINKSLLFWRLGTESQCKSISLPDPNLSFPYSKESCSSKESCPKEGWQGRQEGRPKESQEDRRQEDRPKEEGRRQEGKRKEMNGS